MWYWRFILIIFLCVGCTNTQEGSPAPTTTSAPQTTAPPLQTDSTYVVDECEEQTAISMHDSCYYDKAMEQSELNYCELMYFNSAYCTHELAIKTNNIDLCSISWDKDTCYYKVALNMNNYEYCELLTEEKINCILEIAKQSKDSAKCAELNETC